MTAASSDIGPGAGSAERLRGDARRQDLLPVIPILLLALALRLYQLGAESLWVDEGHSIRDAQEISPFNQQRPLYYWILRFWMQFGDSEAWLRLPAVLFGIGGIFTLYLIALRLATPRVAALASLLMTLTISEIDHAQEVRMYTLAPFLTLCSLYALILWVEERRREALAAHALCGWLALATMPTTLFALFPAGALALAAVRKERRAMLALIAAYVVLGLAWLPLALATARVANFSGGVSRWLAPPAPKDLFTMVNYLLTNDLHFHGWTLWHRLARNGFLLSIYVLIAVAALNPGKGAGARRGWLVALWFAAPFLGIFLISIVKTPLWVQRYLQPIAPGLYLLLAMGIDSLWQRARLAAALAGGLVFSALIYSIALYYPQDLHEHWRGAAAWVQQRAAPHDKIVILIPDKAMAQSPQEATELAIWRRYYRIRPEAQAVFVGIGVRDRADASRVARALAPLFPLTGRVWLIVRGDPGFTETGFLPALETYLQERSLRGETLKLHKMNVYSFMPQSARPMQTGAGEETPGTEGQERLPGTPQSKSGPR